MKHIINLQENHWSLMHPLTCRPNLFDCPYNTAALQEDRPVSFTGFGNYEVYLKGSTLLVGAKLEELPETELEQLRKMKSIQLLELDKITKHGDKVSDYSRGYFNGLELALSTLEDRSPKFLHLEESE